MSSLSPCFPKNTRFAMAAAMVLLAMAGCTTRKRSSDADANGKGKTETSATDHAAGVDFVLPPQDYFGALIDRHLEGKTENALLGDDPVALLYLAFEPAVINRGYGPDDSFLLCAPSVSYPAARLSLADQEKVVTMVQKHFTDAGAPVKVTNAKPGQGLVTTIHVGGTYASLGCKEDPAIMGIAPLDRKNRNPYDVGFVFADRLPDIAKLAAEISHQAGHTYGLEHVDDAQDLMFAGAVGVAQLFKASRLSASPETQDGPAYLRDHALARLAEAAPLGATDKADKGGLFGGGNGSAAGSGAAGVGAPVSAGTTGTTGATVTTGTTGTTGSSGSAGSTGGSGSGTTPKVYSPFNNFQFNSIALNFLYSPTSPLPQAMAINTGFSVPLSQFFGKFTSANRQQEAMRLTADAAGAKSNALPATVQTVLSLLDDYLAKAQAQGQQTAVNEGMGLLNDLFTATQGLRTDMGAKTLPELLPRLSKSQWQELYDVYGFAKGQKLQDLEPVIAGQRAFMGRNVDPKIKDFLAKLQASVYRKARGTP